jgi:hypothetical protein
LGTSISGTYRPVLRIAMFCMGFLRGRQGQGDGAPYNPAAATPRRKCCTAAWAREPSWTPQRVMTEPSGVRRTMDGGGGIAGGPRRVVGIQPGGAGGASSFARGAVSE